MQYRVESTDSKFVTNREVMRRDGGLVLAIAVAVIAITAPLLMLWLAK